MYTYRYNPRSGKFDIVQDSSLLKLKGAVATTADLPLSGNTENDLYVVKEGDRLYTWNKTEPTGLISDWVDTGAVSSIAWNTITDKPNSSVLNIDDAVDKKHDQNTDTIIQGSGSPVDQEQDIFSTETALKVGDGYDSAQTFIANKTGNLVKVKFWATRRDSATERDLVVEIRSTDVDGKPTAVVLATETIASSNFPSTGASATWVNYMLTFSSPLAIVTDTKYAIVWRVAQSDGYYHIGDDGVIGDYTRGEYYRTVLGDENWATWFDYTTYFATYVQIDTTDIINNGVLKEDLNVDDLIKIDGRDVSVDGIKLDTIEESSVALTTVKADSDVASAISLKHAAVTVTDSDTIDFTLTAQDITAIVKTDSINDTHIDWGYGANQINSTDLLDHNGHTVRDTFVHIINRGVSEAITVSLTGGLGISWTVGEIYDINTHSFVSTEVGSGNVTNTTHNYLKWVSGTTLTLSTSEATGNEVLVATFSVYDGVINGYREASLTDSSIANARRGLRALFPNRVISGMSVHEDTDATNPLDVTMDAGVVWKEAMEKKTPVEIKSRNTAMVRHFHTAGVLDSDTNAQIETTNYNNPSKVGGQGLEAIPAHKYVKGLFIYMNDKIGFVYPIEYFNTIAQAQNAALPAMPTGLEQIPKLTAIVYQQGATDFTSTVWQDVRAGLSEESFAGISDHGVLSGLSDTADHPYAFLIDGTRAMTGNLDVGANKVTVNSIEIVGADGEVNKAAVESSGNWDTAYTHSQVSSGNPHGVTPTELSLVIGTNVQAFDTALNSISGLVYASDSFIKLTAEDTYSVRTIAEVKTDLSLNNVTNDAQIPAAEKAAANGVATLGADSKIPNSQLPALAITETSTAISEAAQLALTVQEGDVCVRTDENKSYIALNATNATMADWQELLTPTDSVTSVNGKVGVVSLVTTDISEGTNKYYTEARVSANTEVVANTAKDTNVSTTLSVGTVNATTYGITSDGGVDDIVLPEADTNNAGLLGADKWDEIVANTAAKHTQNTDTALGAQSENLDMNTHKIVGVVDPTANQDVATKKYTDDTFATKGANADITSTTALTQITRATGGTFDIAIGGAAGDDFTVDTNKLVVEGDTGDVGIGTNPGAKLDIAGNVRAGIKTGNTNKCTTFSGEQYDSSTETEGWTVFHARSEATANLVRIGGSASAENAATGIDFFTAANVTTRAGTKRLGITSTGVIEITSGQLKFPATAVPSSDPNTIDDYEEGTYTVTVIGSTSGSYTVNTTYDIFSYTKIGRQVTVTGFIDITAASSPVGNIHILLPFACADLIDSSGRAIGLLTLYNHTGTIPNAVNSRVLEGNSYFDITNITDSGAYTNINNTDIGTAWALYSTITYPAS